MSTRARRGGAAAATATADAAAPDAAAVAAPAAPAAAAAAPKRKAAAVKRESAADDAEETTSNDAAGNATPKANRRQSKKAKLESAAAAAAAVASRTPTAKRRAAKAARVAEEKEEEERELEAFLFGNEDALLNPVEQEEQSTAGAAASGARGQQQQQQSKQEGGDMFALDTTGAGGVKEEGATKVKQEGGKKQGKGKGAADADGADAAAAAPAPAWADADDDAHSSALVDLSSAPRLRKLKTSADERFISGAEYSRRLRAVFAELNPGTAGWATLKDGEGASDADITTLLLQTASSSGTAGGSGRMPGGAARGEPLPSTTIDLLRLKDANLADPSQSIVSSVRFHPAGQLMLTAGLDKMVRLFQVDGQENAKVQGIWLEDMPVHSADWLRAPGQSAASSEIIATGRRQHFYSIDIETAAVTRVPGIRGREDKSLESMSLSPCGAYIAVLGNDGYILLLSARTKQYVGCMKQNGSVRSIAFSPDGALLFSTGSDGTVYVWDVASRRALYRHQDAGSVNGTAIAVDQADKGYYAVGSDSGVVNLYNTAALSERIAAVSASSGVSASARLSALSRSTPPSPLKSLMNLTTPIDELRFNSDASLLLMASRRKKDSLKLVHTATGTVFANWPTSSTPLHYVSSLDFSPNSGYMAIGNDRGRVLLYRLTHYPRA